MSLYRIVVLLFILVTIAGCGRVEASAEYRAVHADTRPKPAKENDRGAAQIFVISGRVDRIDDDIWTIAGSQVRVTSATMLAGAPATGSLVRVNAQRPQYITATTIIPVAIRVAPLRDATIVGVVTLRGDDRLALDGREILLPAGFVVDPRIVVGSLARVVVRYDDDDDDRLIARTVVLLPNAQVIEGPLERFDDDGWLQVGGRRWRLGDDVTLSRITLVIGAPLRLVIIPAVAPTIVAITVVQVNIQVTTIDRQAPPLPATPAPAAPPFPAPANQPIIIISQPAPRQPSNPPQRQNNDRDDDDDDDDDD